MEKNFNEELLIRWLTRFGPLPKDLIYKLLKSVPHQRIAFALKSLYYQNSISIAGNLVSASRDFVCNTKMIDALWVLTCFMDNVNPVDINSLEFPSNIFFLQRKKNLQMESYEIAVFNKGEENFLRLLHVDKRTYYIFVVPSENDIDSFLPVVQSLKIAPSRFIFACVRRENLNSPPEIKFYKIENEEVESE